MTGTAHPHLLALAAALDREEAWQRRELGRLAALELPERVAAGVAWSPLQVDGSSYAGRGRVDVLLRAPRGELLHDQIDTGDLVRVAPVGRPDDGPTGRVVGRDARAAEVRLRGEPDLGATAAVTKVFDPTTFTRYRTALRAAGASPSPLRDVLLGLRPIGEPRAHALHHPAFDALNASQHRAALIATATAEVALVHGPPGTGKTQVIAALLTAWVAAGDRPWALADSNAAVDHLALRARAAGLDVVRLGHPARIGSEVRALSLEQRIASGPYGQALTRLEREISRAEGGVRYGLVKERDALAATARAAALDSSQVIASTLGTLAGTAATLPAPNIAVVDEATQAIEPALWSVVPWVKRLVLVGDPNQLGPVVLEPGNELQQSMVERLLPSDLPMPMLTVQHRMRGDIQALVRGVYGPALRPHPSVAERRLDELPGVAHTPLTAEGLLWVDTSGAGFEEARDPTTRSLFNTGEVAVACIAVRRLLEAGLPASEIGVITPYNAQVARISAQLPGVEVASVNAFQGREKEAIVCSFVRANRDGDLGFVADERRLTVAVTRARRLLVCIGNAATLAHHRRFEALTEAFSTAGAFSSVWEEPWSAALEDV